MALSYDRHHILPRSKGGSNVRDNIIRLDIRRHQALHMLFENRTPPEQIARILEISSTALTEEVKSDILDILSVRDIGYWYNPGVKK